MSRIRVAIVGYGQFGRFMAKQLRPYCVITPIDTHTKPTVAANCDVIIFAVPWNSLEAAIQNVRPHIKPTALIVDVMSIKQAPLTMLKRYFKGFEILGTHPIFGPQSGKRGIKGMPIVLSNVSVTKKHYQSIKTFLVKELQLTVIEQTPKQHDADMAEVQGLTHLIGRAINKMGLKSHVTNTQSYEQLLELKTLLSDDSWELFTTIQNGNPKATAVRKKFIREILRLDTSLNKEHSKNRRS